MSFSEWLEDNGGKLRCSALAARVDVWVETPLRTGWLLAYVPPAWALRPELALLRSVERYERWCGSMRRETQRVVMVRAKGVRLTVGGHVVALCGSPDICRDYGIDAALPGELGEDANGEHSSDGA